MSKPSPFVIGPAVLMLAGLGCGFSRQRTPAIGEGFVAPMSLQVRSDLTPRAPVTATVRHGERVEVLSYRRRFAEVRTAEGIEGWTDGRQLLSAKAMTALRDAHEQGRILPSQGRLIAFDLLNVHIGPNRLSPSFSQLTEDAPAELIERKVTARTPYDPNRDTSRDPVPEGTLKDDWARVRLPDGRSGWVLARMTMMDLPDEITQFANGHRITAAFPMGTVFDDGQSHQSWLWMTIASPPEEFQFDSMRLFAWNPKRDRYETKFVERGLRGYYPVLADTTEQGAPRIRVITEKENTLIRRTFVLTNGRLRLVDTEPWTPPAPPRDRAISRVNPDEGSPWQRLRLWWRGQKN
ncbi:MAG: hypothetical protein R2762_19625 [Bryobacteraceae bacterium]